MSVFYLKYRPQKFSDLDLAEVSVSLKKILNNKDIPQSYLFAGPKGAGKTSAARIMARALNCTQVVDGEPCGECDNCKEIVKGSCIDVIEIDAASNRGIDEVRDLKDKAYLLPSKLSRKVFIVDEVHMMTRDAFNALLKLIEEPPKHTIFILCTTDENKIPETVLSRLIKISFQKGNREELKKSLRRVVEGEKVEIDEESIGMIIEKSDGSFRNLQKTFNEIVLEYGQKISVDQVKIFFTSRTGEYLPEEMEMDLVEGRVAEILTKIEKMAEKGVDFRSFRENLLNFFQDKLLGTMGVEGCGVSKMSMVDLEKWLQLLINAGKQEKEISIDQLPLELAVVSFLGKGFINKRPMAKEEPEIIIETKPLEISGKIEAISEEKGDLRVLVETLEKDWGKVLMAIKPINQSVEAFLRATRPKSVKGNLVTLEVFYPFHKDKLEEQKNRQLIEKSLSKVLGADLVFQCVLSKNKQKSLVIKNDTPDELVNEKLTEDKKNEDNGDMYDVAKQIFG